MKKILILDSNALMHRAYHALPRLKDPNGQIVNSVYGFASILFKFIKELAPEYLVAAFDVEGPSLRKEQYQDYKAKRIKPDQEFYDQIPLIKQMLDLLKIPIYGVSGYEADDVIGSISTQLNQQNPNLEINILTGDLDLLQLVNQKTKILFLKTGISQTAVFDIQAVKQKYGFSPKRLVDYKALRGDASDNIPGVPGVGDKTACELIGQFKNLKQLYQQLETSNLNVKLKARLKEYQDKAFLSYDLAKIKLDLDLNFDLNQARWGDYNEKELICFFEKLGFNSLIKRLDVL